MASRSCFSPFVCMFLLYGCLVTKCLAFDDPSSNDPGGPVAEFKALAEADPCRGGSSRNSRGRPSPNEACASALRKFQLLPESEQSPCLHASGPAICRPQLPPDPDVLKCSFVCEVLQPVPQWEAPKPKARLNRRLSGTSTSTSTRNNDNNNTIYKSIQEIANALPGSAARRPVAPPPPPSTQRSTSQITRRGSGSSLLHRSSSWHLSGQYWMPPPS